MVAQDRGQLDQAENWYRQSLTILQELGDRPGIASSFGQLGMLAEQRGQPTQALEWMVRCVVLFDEFPHPATGPAPIHLARLSTDLGIDTLKHCWRQVTDKPIPAAVQHFIEQQTNNT
jgi:hypothetical protein